MLKINIIFTIIIASNYILYYKYQYYYYFLKPTSTKWKIKQETTAVGDYSVAVNVLRKETAFPRRRAMIILI